MKTTKQKLYCYVDETGQDTLGKFFLVVVVLNNLYNIDVLQTKLLEIEKLTEKNLMKWTKTPFKVKKEYLLKLSTVKELKGSVFYSSYHDTKEYIVLIALTIAKSILSKENNSYEVTIIIDGLNKSGREEVRKEMNKLKINYNKIRGMKDEQDPLLRLADNLAGLLRDFIEKQIYTKTIIGKFKKEKIITEV